MSRHFEIKDKSTQKSWQASDRGLQTAGRGGGAEFRSISEEKKLFFLCLSLVSISDVDFKMSSVDFVHFVEGSEALLLFKTDNHLPTI